MISVVAIWISVMITQCSNIWHDQQLRPPSQRLLLAKQNWADLASASPSNFGDETTAQLRYATNFKKKCVSKNSIRSIFQPSFSLEVTKPCLWSHTDQATKTFVYIPIVFMTNIGKWKCSLLMEWLWWCGFCVGHTTWALKEPEWPPPRCRGLESRGKEGLHLDVGAQRAPRLLISNIQKGRTTLHNLQEKDTMVSHVQEEGRVVKGGGIHICRQAPRGRWWS